MPDPCKCPPEKGDGIIRQDVALARPVLRSGAERMCVYMRYPRTIVVAAGLLLTALPAGALAQEQRVNFSIGGGYTAPNSDVRDHLGDGYNFNLGLQVNVSPVIGIEGVYSYNGLGDKQITLPVSGQPIEGGVPTDFFGSMNMQYGTANLIVQKPDGGVRPYGLVGMGVYYRPVKVSTPGVDRAGLLRSVVVLLRARRIRPG